MKNKKVQNKTSKRTKYFITSSPLLRFKHKRHRQVKKEVLKGLVVETSHLEKPEQMQLVNLITSTKEFSMNNKSLESFSNPSIIKMSSRPNTYTVDNSFSLQHYSKKNSKEPIDSLKCLMSTSENTKIPVSKQLTGNINFRSGNSNQLINQDRELNSMKVIWPSCKENLQINQNNFSEKIIDINNEYIVSKNLSNLKKQKTLIHELNGYKFLVIMKPESCLYLVGIIELELLAGSIEVLGYMLNKQKQKLLIFSLPGSSHLCLKSKSNLNSRSTSISFDTLTSIGLSEITSKKVLNENRASTYFIIKKDPRHVSSISWPVFFENHLSFPIFPPHDLLNNESRPYHSIEQKTNCLFEENLHELGFKEFKQISEWTNIENDIIYEDFPKTILCGGKSVGKSTLLRYLTNKCLQKWNSVLVIDFDLGQCEFTVPGCISATLIEEPVLGPNYSHLKEPLRSVFLGEVDVTKCPEYYIESCKSLVNFAKLKYDTIPWIVNTMGFTRGFGVTLTCGIIKNVNPTHVIEIESKNRKLNFPSRLCPGFVYCQNVGAFDVGNICKDYKLYNIPSASERQGNTQHSRGLSPPEARNLVVLSYFSGMLNSQISTLPQVAPYMINMEQVELKTTDKYNLTKTQIAATMNGNMVALCSFEEGNEFPNCLGFGIVRGIDWQAATMFLITPMPNETLIEVNCLIKGNVALPESLYYNQGMQIVGHIPYMAHTSGRPTSKFARRDFRTLPTTPRDDKKI